MGQTFAMKVLSRVVDREVKEDEIVFIEPDIVLSHDNTAAIIGKFESTIPESRVKYPDKLAIVLDHVIPAATSKNAEAHKKIRDFVRQQDIRNFFDIGTGICHQVLPEMGLTLPGSIIVGSDSHTCTYGAFNCFATGIDRTETAGLWITGKTWFRVPKTIEVTLEGFLSSKVSAKDLILTIIGDMGADGANYMAVEFHGTAISTLRMSERMTIANMGVEMGAKIAVFPADRITDSFLKNRGTGLIDDRIRTIWSDLDAPFAMIKRYDLGTIVPVVAKPHAVDNVVPVKDLPSISIDQVYIGTCTGGRLEDFEAASAIMKGKRIADGVRLLLGPASKEVYLKTIEKGYLQNLIEAGGTVLPPGCGPCLGAHQGVMAPGERCLSTANRNFKGRMGEKEAEIYLCSAETAAASAITGEITDPRSV